MFTREIHTEREIDAPPERVWEVLTDFAAYGAWNPQITAVEGVAVEGADVDLTVQHRGRERSITATITAVEPARRLEWVASLGGPWLYEGRHTFELRAHDGDRTEFVNREHVSGITAPLIVRPGSDEAYEAMNRALAERVRALERDDTP
ncbi:SRPBCC domain-containing protein [Salinigranum salinum]|uniref:SRPBCC domain-containing protein n=1 Tax=Salinigranum salinum TaxID=1364937 RepID=UPI001260ACE6|nr:SRPBCC domain-containing protein [Salinigranum salinum]